MRFRVQPSGARQESPPPVSKVSVLWRGLLAHRHSLAIGLMCLPFCLIAFGVNAGAAPLSGGEAGAPFRARPIAFIAFQEADCAIQPRTSADFLAAIATPAGVLALLSGTPVTTPALPVGADLASEAEIAGITQTMEQLAACVNAGDLPRAASLFSDDYFFWFFGGISEEQVRQLNVPMPLPESQQVTAVVVSEVSVLDDGRIRARTQLNTSAAETIFVKVADTFLIDYSYELPSTATPTP